MSEAKKWANWRDRMLHVTKCQGEMSDIYEQMLDENTRLLALLKAVRDWQKVESSDADEWHSGLCNIANVADDCKDIEVK